MRTGLLALAALLAVAGCQKSGGPVTVSGVGGSTGGSASSTPSPAPEGFHRVASKDGSFTLSVPKGWVTLNSSDPDFAKAQEELDAKQAGLGANLMNASTIIQDWGAMKLDEVTTEGKFVTNANVIVSPAAPKNDKEIEDGVAAAKKDPRAAGLDAEVVKDFYEGSALHVWGSMTMGDIAYEIEQYTVFHGGKSYHVTLSFPEGKADRDLAVKVAKSLEVK